ncbi:MAG: hypothetical protein WD688_11210 [Candidatus Binatia bacterium]
MSNQASVIFPSAGLKLSGIVHTPTDLKTGERRPVFLILHGFGRIRDYQNTK